jgi:spore coat protein U-like protein
MKTRMAHIFFFIVALSVSFHSYGACDVSNVTTPISFGNVDSKLIPGSTTITPNGNSQAGEVTITCTSGINVALLGSGSWASYTAQSPLTLTNGASSIPYILGVTPGFAPQISAQGQSIGGSSGFTLLELMIPAGDNYTLPVFTRTSLAASAPWPKPGVYTGTQTLKFDGMICRGLAAIGVCLTPMTFSSTRTITLTLTVVKSCEISSGGSAAFGNRVFLDGGLDTTMTIGVRCSDQEDYLFYIDNGNHFSTGSRHMRRGTFETIPYAIYKPSSATELLSITNKLSMTGNGTVQNIVMPVRVPSGLSTPRVGNYTDAVRAVIEY